jgi:hypothetical protein
MRYRFWRHFPVPVFTAFLRRRPVPEIMFPGLSLSFFGPVPAHATVSLDSNSNYDTLLVQEFDKTHN